MLPVLPGGGGAETGRVSVERLTAVTDRSATGISEVSLAALSTYSRGRGGFPNRTAAQGGGTCHWLHEVARPPIPASRDPGRRRAPAERTMATRTTQGQPSRSERT